MSMTQLTKRASVRFKLYLVCMGTITIDKYVRCRLKRIRVRSGILQLYGMAGMGADDVMSTLQYTVRKSPWRGGSCMSKPEADYMIRREMADTGPERLHGLQSRLALV